MTPFTFNAAWVSEVREALRELAAATGTDLPRGGLLDRYLVNLYRAAGGEASRATVVEACAALGREWQEGHFPPAGVLARYLPKVATDPGPASPWPAGRPWRRHTATAGTSPRAYTPEQLAAAQAVRDAFWARHSRRADSSRGGRGRTRGGDKE